MRVMMIKGDPEAGAAPSGELLTTMGRWSRIYPGEYGAEVEIELRQVFEPEVEAST
jgi:hypothetical protein